MAKTKKSKTTRKIKWEVIDHGIVPYEQEDWPKEIWRKNVISFGSWVEPKYKTPTDMLKVIREYFEKGHRKKTILDRYGHEVIVWYLTVTDLVLYLGFSSRQSLSDYENKEVEIKWKEWKKETTKPFAYIIRRARLFIEREYEELLRENPAAAMFVLRSSFRWESGWFGKMLWEWIWDTWGDDEERVVVYVPDNWRVKKE